MDRPFSKNASSVLVVALALVTACSPERTQGPKPMDIGRVVALSQRDLNALAGSQLSAAQNGRQQRGVEDDMLRIEAVAPGFAGYYLDSNGDIVARLSNVSNQSKAEGAIRQLIARREVGKFNPLGSVKHISFAPATFPLSRLIAWQDDLFPLLAGITGFSSIGVSESANQLIVGVTASAREAAAGVIRARGVPDAAVSFRVAEGTIHAASGLRGTWRPTSWRWDANTSAQRRILSPAGDSTTSGASGLASLVKQPQTTAPSLCGRYSCTPPPSASWI